MCDDFVNYNLIIEKYVDIGMIFWEFVDVLFCYSDNMVGNLIL